MNREFIYEFFLQMKKSFGKEEIVKPKVKERDLEIKHPEELPFIRPLFRKKKLVIKKLIIKKEPQKIMEPRVKEIKGPSAIEQLTKIMEDSTIDSIESHGFDKKVIIKRGNIIINNPISLDNEDIKQIFTFIERENNEELGKMFKTNFRNFEIHGIKSSFIGYSFILTRKNLNVYQ